MNELLDKISIEDKTGIRILNSLFIIALIYNYCFIFLSSFDIIIEAVTPYKNIESDFFNFLIFMCVYILTLVFLSYEGLTDGTNPFARAFNKIKPSKYIQDTFNTTQEIASAVWFKHFNNLNDKKITIARGFACRFVYNILLSLIIFIILSTTTYFIEWYLHGTVINFETKLMIIGFAIFLGIMVFVKNNPFGKKPNGVWKNFNEINDNHCIYIDQNRDTIKKEIEQAQKRTNA